MTKETSWRNQLVSNTHCMVMEVSANGPAVNLSVKSSRLSSSNAPISPSQTYCFRVKKNIHRESHLQGCHVLNNVSSNSFEKIRGVRYYAYASTTNYHSLNQMAKADPDSGGERDFNSPKELFSFVLCFMGD